MLSPTPRVPLATGGSGGRGFQPPTDTRKPGSAWLAFPCNDLRHA